MVKYQQSTAKRSSQRKRKAISNLLKKIEKLNCTVTTIHADGELKAFSINEAINNKYAICHFEKALKIHHQHIYAFLAREGSQKFASTRL
jgi:hypothetical protein